MRHEQSTITVIERNGKILLGKKKRGYAEGIWNGYGGKVESGETIEQSMIRELTEESGLRSLKHEKVAYIEFINDIDDYISECHIYKVNEYEGELHETEEISPRWFKVDELPFSEMWPDDFHWLPLVLQGKKVRGHFVIKNHKTIEHFELTEVDSF